LVSDQPSWGRRTSSMLSISDSPAFQTNPRGVGGSLATSGRRRPSHVSDQPSWGRRPSPSSSRGQPLFQTNPRGVGGSRPKSARSRAAWFQTNPRGVGGPGVCGTSRGRRVSDQPSWGRRSRCSRVHSTNSQFQTNPRGVGGPSLFAPAARRGPFQTNPRGVGGFTTASALTSRLVSDQPSWGRRC